jgi:GT2 family glycosyltransferase
MIWHFSGSLSVRVRLSIVVPSFRRADLLRECLASLARHAPMGTEVVVVDDASPSTEIRDVATQFGVRFVRLASRMGFCGAINAGLAATSGEFVEFLNDDTTVSSGWAEAALQHFQDHHVAAVSPCVVLPDGTIDTTGDEYDPGGFARKRGHGERWRDGLFARGPVWGVSGVAGFFRRSALDQVGWLPTDFGAYFEDVDLAHRLGAAGYEARFEPESMVTHHLSSSYGRRPSRRTLERQSCNEERVFWRNTPRHAWKHHLPRHVAVLVGKAARRLEEGQFTPWLTGRIRGLLVESGVL